jgi:hypothetical protein
VRITAVCGPNVFMMSSPRCERRAGAEWSALHKVTGKTLPVRRVRK